MKEWQVHNAQLFSKPSTLRFLKPLNSEPVFQAFPPVRSALSNLRDIVFVLAASGLVLLLMTAYRK